MVTSIRQMANDYYDELPDNTPRSLLRSAVFSFSACFLFKQPEGMFLNRPLQAAALAVTASLIHALITPIIKYCFPAGRDRMWYAEIVKSVVALSLTEALTLKLAGSSTMNLYRPLAMNLMAMGWNLTPRRTDTDNADYLFHPNYSTWFV